MGKDKVKSTDKKTDIRLQNLRAPWKKGQSGNPKGHPKGQRNFATIYKEAITQLAKKKGVSVDSLEEMILQVGIAKAMGGDYRFYQDLQDRLNGKPVQRNELTGADGKDLIPDKEAISTADSIIDKFLDGRNKKHS